MTNVNETLQKTVHEASKADREYAKEAGKAIGKAMDATQNEEKRKKEAYWEREVKDISYATAKRVTTNPKYFYFPPSN